MSRIRMGVGCVEFEDSDAEGTPSRVRFLRREEADRLIEALPAHMKPIVKSHW